MPKFIPWPHSPGIIARVEHYTERGELVATHWEGSVNGKVVCSRGNYSACQNDLIGNAERVERGLIAELA